MKHSSNAANSRIYKQKSFLQEPDFSPRFPSKNTLASRALYMMLEGKEISHPDFENSTSSWRLAAHIHILNKLGWNIQTIELEGVFAEKPKRRRMSKYFIDKQTIEKLDEGIMEVIHG